MSVTIFVSGGLDEDSLQNFARADAPIDGIGIGTSLTTSADVPSIDCVYKLQDYAGLPRRKRSENKATWPGRKQVWRRYDGDGRMSGDVLSRDSGAAPPEPSAEPLLQPAMRHGKRIAPSPSLDQIRHHAKRELERLPLPLQRLEPGARYPVEVTDDLIELAAEVDRRMETK